MRRSRELPGSATLPSLRLAIFKKNLSRTCAALPGSSCPSWLVYFKLLVKGHKRKESNKKLVARVIIPGRLKVDSSCSQLPIRSPCWTFRPEWGLFKVQPFSLGAESQAVRKPLCVGWG